MSGHNHRVRMKNGVRSFQGSTLLNVETVMAVETMTP